MKQGEKLLLLVRRDKRTSAVLARELGFDKSYLPKLYKLDFLPPKPLERAQRVFGVPRSYFTDEPEPDDTLQEPLADYSAAGPEAEMARLKQELMLLRAEVARLQKTVEQEKALNATLSEAILNMSKR